MSHQPNNIFAGTQVVALLEVRGPNNSLVHPRGAVGVVTRTPAVAGEKYLVRFPDGFEASFESAQLEVLKQFKDRLGDSAQSNGVHAQPAFDLESVIIYRCVVGSRAYGLDNDDSDTDRRGIYLAPADLQWSLFGAPEQFEDNATQSCYWELQKFLTMALKANPNILECLYSPMVEKVTPLSEELLALRNSFLSQMIFQTFNGYAMSQFKKIEQDIRNSGEIKWKHAMHLLRLLLTGAATLREARVPVRVEAHRDRLLAVKRGELPWAEVDTWRRVFYDIRKIHRLVWEDNFPGTLLDLVQAGRAADLLNFLRTGYLPGQKPWVGVFGQSAGAPLFFVVRELCRLGVISPNPEVRRISFFVSTPVRRAMERIGWITADASNRVDFESLASLSDALYRRIAADPTYGPRLLPYYDIPLLHLGLEG